MSGNPLTMTIRRPGSVTRSPDGVASAPFWVEMLLEGEARGENTAMRATLDPGTITNWHTHPRGQLLYVLSGTGRAQRDGGPVEELRTGDAVWFAPHEKHWHGAAAGSPFSYISIQATDGERIVDWLEPVEISR
ncbi:cupin domain-containing protein [Rhizobium sp. RAF36]|jgi:quercetin dioxygenase-like cupin family protein|uniref:cupin domain-containing protein n=1 Tax=Rhizobium sp. RAF36 TaxID=3233055 RepID=UPI000DD9D0D1